jgi:hypothetical protein
MCIIEKRDGGFGLDFSGSIQGPLVGFCEHGSENLGSIKLGEFLDQLSMGYS